MSEGKMPLVRFCQVIDVKDDTDADRIKVRLIPEDNDKRLEDIDYAFPLLPKMFSVKPKEGEAVLVLLATANDGNSQRYYIGPVISQINRMYKDPFFDGADSFQRGGHKEFDPAASMDPKTRGIFPKDDDISIVGRKNCDIQIKNDDIRIRAGVKVVNEDKVYTMSFNKKNPAYIKLKYHPETLFGDVKSTATIVADKINLLSNSSPNRVNGAGKFTLTDQEDLITDEAINEVLNEAYKLPYGERLVAFLEKFVKAFVNHRHDFIALPPNKAFTDPLLKDASEELGQKRMLSDTIRIN